MTMKESMLNFLKYDHDTYQAFTNLKRLIQRNSIGVEEEEIQDELLTKMLENGCFNNPEKTQDFIIHNYFITERTGPIFKPRRVRGLRL